MWVTNRLKEARGFFSVNGFALEFSDWGDAPATDANFSLFDDELALLDPQVAREYGVADLDERGDWIVGDVRRLERV